MSFSATNLIWVDLEMTGLDTIQDHIIEIATVITDSQLNIIAYGPELAIFQTDEVLNGMDAWNTKQHTRSGLVERVRQSSITLEDAAEKTLEFLMQYVPANQSPMCGNSICQDRRFLYRQMPTLEKYFHYRNLDVSTIKELARHWSPNLYKGFKKEAKHRALEDIKESIEELRYYRTHFFRLEEC